MIKQRIEGMLKENTGKHLMDSGSAYGRHWERNQDKDFENESVLDVEVWKDEVDISLSVYHYLINVLEVTKESEDLDSQFKDYMENSDKNYLVDMEDFADLVSGLERIQTVNTYNYQNLLSQTLQYVLLSSNKRDWVYADRLYIILQIHGGCDVRGGYTVPQIFKIKDSELFITAQSQVRAIDEMGMMSAFSDDAGYTFHETDMDKWIYDEENNKVYYDNEENEIIFESYL